MMKRIFSLFFILFASVNLTAEYSFDFEIKENFEFPYAQARAEANKIIIENAYLAYHNKSEKLKACWKNYSQNKKIKINITDSFIKKLSSASRIYRVSFDPSKIMFHQDHSEYHMRC